MIEQTAPQIIRVETDDQILSTYEVMRQLRPDLQPIGDDFVTDERARSSGYGKQLMDWLKTEAREHGCTELQLISRVTRERAHRFYFREGFSIECFHFRTTLG
ncbi:MAG TPA: GNAT family N-acetyltransferase [Longimicrobiales bacterium]|nr:GNAT family N-acetyltransferase [Longimicrobiales bacterium]